MWARSLRPSLNPYFTGLSILICKINKSSKRLYYSLNPYFTGLSILIMYQIMLIISYLLKSQSLFYWIIYSYFMRLSYPTDSFTSLNPYFTGLSILMGLEVWGGSL